MTRDEHFATNPQDAELGKAEQSERLLGRRDALELALAKAEVLRTALCDVLEEAWRDQACSEEILANIVTIGTESIRREREMR